MRFDRLFVCLLALQLALGPAACCCVWSGVGRAVGLTPATVEAAAPELEADACQLCCDLDAAPNATPNATPSAAETQLQTQLALERASRDTPRESKREANAPSCCDEGRCAWILDESAVLAEAAPSIRGDHALFADHLPFLFGIEAFVDAFASRGSAGVGGPPSGRDRSPTLLASTGREWLPWGRIWRC